MILALDGLVEGGQILRTHLLLVVLQQGGKHFLVECLIPFVTVVLDLEVLLLTLIFRTLKLVTTSIGTHGTGGELVGAVEGLYPIHKGANRLIALTVRLTHQVEIQLVLQIACLILEGTDACLEFLLLTDNADGIDTFVHTDGVLPVVGTLCILTVVLDTNGL